MSPAGVPEARAVSQREKQTDDGQEGHPTRKQPQTEPTPIEASAPAQQDRIAQQNTKTKTSVIETEDNPEEEWTEEVDARFSKAFDQLSRLSELRQKSLQMSDHGRREFAASTALALAQAFGLDIEDSDSD